MRISPGQAISRLGARLEERRRRARDGERPPLTGDDEANIADFARLVQDTIAVLSVENDALVAGDVEKVVACYAPKSDLLKSLTLRQPVIEPFLREDTAGTQDLRVLIRKLSESLERNGTLLLGMASASRSIMSEVEAIRRRQSLDGVYDKTGTKRPGLGPRRSGFAKKI